MVLLAGGVAVGDAFFDGGELEESLRLGSSGVFENLLLQRDGFGEFDQGGVEVAVAEFRFAILPEYLRESLSVYSKVHFE